MKSIPLKSKSFKNKECLVDDEDYEFLIQWQWTVLLTNKIFYAARYEKRNGKNKCIKMHRVLLNLSDSDKNTVVDHKDHDGLNNQKNNIRACVASDNAKNRSSYGRSRYLGVSLLKKKKGQRVTEKWQVNIQNRYIGVFNTQEEAARAYDKEAVKVHGEFANLNFK